VIIRLLSRLFVVVHLTAADRNSILDLWLREASEVSRIGGASLKHDAHLIDLVHVGRLVMLERRRALGTVGRPIGVLRRTRAHRHSRDVGVLAILVQDHLRHYSLGAGCESNVRVLSGGSRQVRVARTGTNL
jgi:hypothetical protein